MVLHKLVPDVRIFERNLSFDIEALQSRMDFLNLLFPINHAITAIKVTDNQLFLVPTIPRQDIFISIAQQLFVISSFTYQQDHFVDHH